MSVTGILSAVVQWRYFGTTFCTTIVIIVVVLFGISHRKWRSGWISLLVEKRLRDIGFYRTRSPLRIVPPRTRLPGLWLSIKHLPHAALHHVIEYFRRDLRLILADYYIPSLTTVLIALIVLGCILFIPDPPQHASMLLKPKSALEYLINVLEKDKGLDRPEKLFEGLIAILIALIFFVAESIRSVKSSDERRVLLKLSNLWLLGVLITILPLTFIYPPGTGLAVLLIVCVAGLTLWTFGKVLGSLLSLTVIADEQRKFLRQRVRRGVIESAKQRMGNRILSERLGADKDIKITFFALGKLWLPGGADKYELVAPNTSGALTDVNLTELRQLAAVVNRREEALARVQPATSGELTAAPSRRSRRGRHASTARPDTAAYLLRRFGEEPIGNNNIFAPARPLIAIRRAIARDDDLLNEVKARARRAFVFTDEEPPSNAFQDEMKVTKDRLIAAIAAGALGEIGELRETYLVVAEEFLVALNDLGGGYSAEQAREERNAFFEGWTEVRWLRDDVRDLIVAASRSDNADVVRQMIYLPFAIANRAFLAGDQLLFQEFMTFGSFIYSLGREKPAASDIGRVMMDRSWQYVKDLLRFNVEPALSEGDTDDD